MKAIQNKITASAFVMLIALNAGVTNLKAQEVVNVSSLGLMDTRPENPGLRSVMLGVNVMPTLSTYDLRTYSGSTIKGQITFGCGYGAMLGINSTKHTGLQLEVIYNSFSQQYSQQDVSRKVTLYYVNVPLLLSLNTDRTAPINLNVVAGPQAGINVGSNYTTSGSDTTHAILEVRKGDVGVAYGAGLEFALNSSHTIHLNLGFRGVFGLIGISDNKTTVTYNAYYILPRTQIETYSGYAGLSISL